MDLSIRLQNIADQVDARRVADIGCDHGKLVAYLFENHIIDWAYVSDISMPSVQKAVKVLEDMKVDFDWSCGDGTQKMTDKLNIEQVIISGMGGLEIVKILSDNKVHIDSWILQPQNNEICLKKYLIKNKYKIIKDFIVKDKNIYYNILKVVKTDKTQKLSEYQMYFGKDNFADNPYFSEYLSYMQNKYEKIYLQVPFMKKLKTKKVLRYIKKAKMENK